MCMFVRLIMCSFDCVFVRLIIRSFVLRFQPDKEFSGTDRGHRRDGPVQFEKEEEDPFGLDKFLTEAKKGKRSLDEPSRSRFVMNGAQGRVPQSPIRLISKLSCQFVCEYETDYLPKCLKYDVEIKTNGPSFSSFKLVLVAGSSGNYFP